MPMRGVITPIYLAVVLFSTWNTQSLLVVLNDRVNLVVF